MLVTWNFAVKNICAGWDLVLIRRTNTNTSQYRSPARRRSIWAKPRLLGWRLCRCQLVSRVTLTNSKWNLTKKSQTENSARMHFIEGNNNSLYIYSGVYTVSIRIITVDNPYHSYVRRCISQPPGPIFQCRYLYSWKIVDDERSALETFRRELSEVVSFGIDSLFVVDQSSLGSRSRGVWYTRS